MPNDEASARLRTLVYDIRVYLLKNPQARDALSGIQRWWIPGGAERFTDEEVQAALDFMVNRGWVEKVLLADTVLYSATKRGLSEPGNGIDGPTNFKD